MIDTEEAQFALRAVQQASNIVRQVQHQLVSPAITKQDRSPVTVGDFAAQAVVGKLLAETFPNDPLVGEEDADALRAADGQETLAQVTTFVRAACPDLTAQAVCDLIDHGNGEPSDRFWTVDPIDGTKGFLRGDQYAVCLALIEKGVVTLGVIGCPNLSTAALPDIGGSGAIFIAGRGQGSWVAPLDTLGNFRPISCSARTSASDARLLRSVEAAHTHGGKIDQLVENLSVTAEPVRMDSQAKYAVLAAGGGDVIARLISESRQDYREKIWDQAAGSILVEEAGGRVTDLGGKPLDFGQGKTLAQNRGVLASNGHLHDDFLKALVAIGA